MSLSKIDIDTVQPNGKRGETQRPAFTKVNAAIDMLSSLSSGSILGLTMEYLGVASVRLYGGSCHVQSSDVMVQIQTQDLTIAGIQPFTAYHLYVDGAGSTPAAVFSTAAPSAPFAGNARSMTGNTARRYIGTVITNASAQIHRFQQNGDEVSYLTNNANPFRVLSGGTAAVRTAVSLSNIVPPTANYAQVMIINNANEQLFVDIPELGNVGAVSRYSCQGGQRVCLTTAAPSRTLQYFYGSSPTGGGAFIDVYSYRYLR